MSANILCRICSSSECWTRELWGLQTLQQSPWTPYHPTRYNRVWWETIAAPVRSQYNTIQMLAVESSWGASTLSSCNTHMNIHETYVSPNSCTVCILALKHRRGLHSVCARFQYSIKRLNGRHTGECEVYQHGKPCPRSALLSTCTLHSIWPDCEMREQQGGKPPHTNRTTHVKSRHNFQQEDMKHTLATEPLPPPPPKSKAVC